MDGILFVNKPMNMTSHDVVSRLRRILHMKKIGHTGTLDPQATGLLMVMVGNCTKVLPFLETDYKEYIAEMKIGMSSDTEDIWGNVTYYQDDIMPSMETILDVFMKFTGNLKQIPPMVSAKKVNGKKLYEYAREGIVIEREPCDIHIAEMELLSYDEQTIRFRCKCSAGTYIRTLCTDVGTACGVHFLMSSLNRTMIDAYHVNDAYTLEQIEQGQFQFFTSIDILRKKYELIPYSNVSDIVNGRKIQLPNANDDLVMVTNEDRTVLYAAYERKEDGFYYSKRGLWA